MNAEAADAEPHTAEVSMSRGELVRRAMAVMVTQQVMDLVINHHRNESDRPLALDHQWVQIYQDPSPDMRIIARAQSGKTLYELVKTMAQCIVGLSVGWVMPKDSKIQELVDGKLNPTIRNTALYRHLMDLSGGNDRVRFKSIGPHGKLYLVTSNSIDELTSFTADAMHIDERDFCNRTNLSMYPARMNYSPYRFTDEISTPTVEGTLHKRAGLHRNADNIHAEFLRGDQHRYYSLCHHCGLWQILDWYTNVINATWDESGRMIEFDVLDKDWSPGASLDLRCCCSNSKCRQPMERLAAGEWRCMNPMARGKMRSYWVEALALSVGPSIADLLERFQKALGNPSKMQDFHNLFLGRTYSGGVLRFTPELFAGCVERGHFMQDWRVSRGCDGPCTIGIDVNRPWFDVQISRWVRGDSGRMRPIKMLAAKINGDTPELIALMKKYKVVGGVVDVDPEAKLAWRLQQEALAQLRCRIVCCRFATGEQGAPIVRSINGEFPHDPPRLISVQKTVMIDAVFEAMQRKEVGWFEDWDQAIGGEMYAEFHTPVRRLVVNDAGRERFIWDGEPNHQLMAAVYDHIAGDILGLNAMNDLSQIMALVDSHPHGLPSGTMVYGAAGSGSTLTPEKVVAGARRPGPAGSGRGGSAGLLPMIG